MAARDTLGKQFRQEPSPSRSYLSRPGTDGADRVYFHNPWGASQELDKMTYYRKQNEAYKVFARQAYGAGYTNSRDFERQPWPEPSY